MAIETRLQIRVEEEYLDMLDEILDKEETEHLMGGWNYSNKNTNC